MVRFGTTVLVLGVVPMVPAGILVSVAFHDAFTLKMGQLAVVLILTGFTMMVNGGLVRNSAFIAADRDARAADWIDREHRFLHGAGTTVVAIGLIGILVTALAAARNVWGSGSSTSWLVVAALVGFDLVAILGGGILRRTSDLALI